MGVNKVNLASGETLIDISDSTITAETIVSGNKGYKADGTPVEGTNPYELNATNTEVNSQALLIAQIQSALEGKAGGGSGITPSGTIDITANGTYDVTSYASAEVNVASSGGLPDTIVAGDTPVLYCFGVWDGTSSSALKDSGLSITIPVAGTYRFKWVAGCAEVTCYSQLYQNGTAVGTQHTHNNSATASEDLTCAAGDVIALWFRAGNYLGVYGNVGGFCACIDWDNGF